MGTAIGFVIGPIIAAGLYVWKSDGKTAKAARTFFKRGRSGGAQPE